MAGLPAIMTTSHLKPPGYCPKGGTCDDEKACDAAGFCQRYVDRSKVTTMFERKDLPDFVEWYVEHAGEDALMIWDKAKAYGGFDIQASYLALLMGRDTPKVDPLDHERTLAFNACQKLARIAEALSHGTLPSEDSWRDLCCYAMIVRRLRVTKTWPA